MPDIDYPTPGTREALAELVQNRHPATQHLLRQFAWHHLPDRLRSVSRPVAELAATLVLRLGDGAELTAGLRKLVEAKDCLVRQALEDLEAPPPS